MMASLDPDTRDAEISFDFDPEKREIRKGTEVTEQELRTGLSELEVLTHQPKSTVRKSRHRRSVSINKFPLGPSPLPTVTTAIPTMAPKAGVPKPGPAKLPPKAGL